MERQEKLDLLKRAPVITLIAPISAVILTCLIFTPIQFRGLLLACIVPVQRLVAYLGSTLWSIWCYDKGTSRPTDIITGLKRARRQAIIVCPAGLISPGIAYWVQGEILSAGWALPTSNNVFNAVMQAFGGMISGLASGISARAEHKGQTTEEVQLPTESDARKAIKRLVLFGPIFPALVTIGLVITYHYRHESADSWAIGLAGLTSGVASQITCGSLVGGVVNYWKRMRNIPSNILERGLLAKSISGGLLPALVGGLIGLALSEATAAFFANSRVASLRGAALQTWAIIGVECWRAYKSGKSIPVKKD